MEQQQHSPGSVGNGGAKKRRIPKACTLCRNSKLRCDGGKPCTRCRTSNIQCEYVRPLRDPVQEKLDNLEQQMRNLSNRITQPQPDTSTAAALLELQQQQQQQQSQGNTMPDVTVNILSPSSSYQGAGTEFPSGGAELESPISLQSVQGAPQAYPFPASSGPNRIEMIGGYGPGALMSSISTGNKRKRSDIEVKTEPPSDLVSRGLLRYDEAVMYFRVFFQGCDKYVPVFDPKFDTFESVRARSAMLFDTICTIGCRAELGPVSPQFQTLSNATKSSICDVILGTIPASLETIQALLVNAAYYEKGWLLTSMALRMALDLELPKSYSDLCSSIVLGDGCNDRGPAEREVEMFRWARVWFGTFILEHILSIDCGKKPGVSALDGMRRVRVLLNHPARTSLDLRVLSQVELNSIRAIAHERLTPRAGTPLPDQELIEIVQGMRIDLNIWLSEWTTLVEMHVPVCERATLLVNMRIQRDWGEMTMLCKGLQGVGTENVAIMSEEQRKLIHLAKASAQRHLSIIISNPDVYLGTFRYGMDFVWAKCAFSVLLLLKLARLVPSSTSIPALIADAKTLLDHLSKARGTNNIYFRILGLTVEKCERALKEDGEGGLNFVDAEMDFQSYVPKEFILEWSFPGLNFCWLPFDFQEMFLDFGTGF